MHPDAQVVLNRVLAERGAAAGIVVEIPINVGRVDAVVENLIALIGDGHPQIPRDTHHARGLGVRVKRHEHHRVGARRLICVIVWSAVDAQEEDVDALLVAPVGRAGIGISQW
ncbi:MAG: hypothetical protein JW395_0803 [Nitrospira sp.]|nr:hypothetical protein [Nitrospira sp.]